MLNKVLIKVLEFFRFYDSKALYLSSRKLKVFFSLGGGGLLPSLLYLSLKGYNTSRRLDSKVFFHLIISKAVGTIGSQEKAIYSKVYI